VRSTAAAVALLAVRNIGGLALPESTYVPVNLAVGAALVGLARADGCSWGDLGMEGRHLGRGLRTGGAVAVGLAGLLAAGAALPPTRGLFDDKRVDVEAGAAELAHQTLLRIPVGTALFEELAFRGVLLALLVRRRGTAGAVLASSALFGLWHVRPTLGAASANGVTGPASAALVAAAVGATAVAGIGFSWLRLRGRHLVAPVVAHAALNDVSYLLSWWVRS
jgi:uncharacterized protein